MPESVIRAGSLVLYKGRPARVKHSGAKLEIALQEGDLLKVRPKDVVLLHPGPMERLNELQPQTGEVETAWEILAGGTTSLAELAELAYGVFTPATAWSAWELVADGLYFHGTPEEVVARLPDEVDQERATRAAKAAEKRAWSSFLKRVSVGQIIPQDGRYLEDVEALALGRETKNRVLHHLGRAERPANAHALLLELGHWDHTVNPYPQRLGLNPRPPMAELPELPDEERMDLTHLAAFAIDDQGAQDPDDALSREGDRLWVHVADAAALVHPGSAADLEARARGANLYLPEGTVSMLPPQATQVLGLGLTEISPALSFGLDLTSGGEIAEIEIVLSWVRVTRLTYAEADARLEAEPFQSLYRLAQVYQARRRENGAVFIDLPEVKVQVQDGEVVVRPLPPLRSRDMVTEAMLMTGEAVARFSLERDIPIPFSSQDPPSPGVPENPTGLADMYALRRGLKRSQIKSVPAPHAGLGMARYAQATSPLRRYLDLVVHQQLRAYLQGGDLLATQEVLERIGAAEAVAGSVRQAERLSRQHWTLVYLLAHPDWHGSGVLVEKYDSRGTLLIPELDLEPRVFLRQDLPLNSLVPLTLSGVDLAELEAHFQVEG